MRKRRICYWYCKFCGDCAPCEEPYEIGDKEPCSICGEGTSLVMTSKEAKGLQKIRTEFFRLNKEWHLACDVKSSVDEIIQHPAYQAIIALGLPVVPLILTELQRSPDHWFAALESITGENPVASKDWGRMSRMADAWIRWGKQHSYINYSSYR